MQWEKPGQKCIINAKKLRYSILPTIEICIFRIGELAPNLYSFNEEDNSISLDTPLDLSVFLAYSGQSKSSTGKLAKELIKRISCKQIE